MAYEIKSCDDNRSKLLTSMDAEQSNAFHKLTHSMQTMTLEYRDDKAMLAPDQRTNASLIYVPERTADSNKLTI